MNCTYYMGQIKTLTTNKRIDSIRMYNKYRYISFQAGLLDNCSLVALLFSLLVFLDVFGGCSTVFNASSNIRTGSITTTHILPHCLFYSIGHRFDECSN